MQPDVLCPLLLSLVAAFLPGTLGERIEVALDNPLTTDDGVGFGNGDGGSPREPVVAVSGDVVVVGASRDLCEGSATNECGSAYVFANGGSGWAQAQKLRASDATRGDAFGYTVAVDGDVAVVGAPGSNNYDTRGSAYVFKNLGGVWTEQAKLTAAVRDYADQFGKSVGVSEGTIVVGAPGDNCGWGGSNANACGAAYVFMEVGGEWVNPAKLMPDYRDDLTYFGKSVGIDGDLAVFGGGGVHVFERQYGHWSQIQRFGPGSEIDDDVLSISGNMVAWGKVSRSRCGGQDCWKAHGVAVSARGDDGAWTTSASRLLGSDTVWNTDSFGFNVALGRNLVVVGAPNAVLPGCVQGCGAAYVFALNGTEWTEEVKIIKQDVQYMNKIGWGVAADCDKVAAFGFGGTFVYELPYVSDADCAPIPDPTPKPTPAPIPPPTPPTGDDVAWDIVYQGIEHNFTAGADDGNMDLKYLVSSGRIVEAQLFLGDCETPAPDDGTITPLGQERNTTNVTHDALVLPYDVDVGRIAGSDHWNNDTNEFEFCQATQLVLYAGERLVIAEDVRVVTIAFDLTAGFNATVALGNKTTSSSNSTGDVASYLKVCKCDPANGFGCDDAPLSPNDQLPICFDSTSAEFGVDYVESMIASQGSASIGVIEESTARIPSITSIEYQDQGDGGISITTRIPSNLFLFRGGSSIRISGSVKMKFSGSNGVRRLQGSTGEGSGGSEQFAFEVDVISDLSELEDEEDEVCIAKGYVKLQTSSASLGSLWVGLTVMIVAAVMIV